MLYNIESLPKLSFDEGRQRDEVEYQISYEHARIEHKGETQIGPQVDILAILVYACLREVVALQQEIGTVAIPGTEE